MLITNVRVVTNDTEVGTFRDGAIYINGNEIVEIGPSEILEKRYAATETEIIEGRGKTVLPGFVNAYVNVESVLFPDFGMEEKFGVPNEDLYKQIHNALQSVFDEQMFYTIIEKIAHDELRQGVTCVAGSIERYLHRIEVDQTIKSVTTTLPFRFAVGEGIQTPEDLQRLIKSGETPRYIPLNSITAFSDEALRALRDFSTDTDAYLVVILSNERLEEQEAFIKYGMSNLERLRQLDLLNDHAVIVNAQHFTETDLDVMASTSTMAVYCPRQMMIRGMDFPNIDGMMGRSVNVSLGTGCVPDLSVLVESQVAFLLRRAFKGGADFDSVYQTKKMLLDNSYHFAGKLFDMSMGKLSPGYVADMAIYDYDGPVGGGRKPTLRNLLFDFPRDARVHMTIVDGKTAYDAGKYDEAELEERIKEVRHKVLSKV